MVLRGYPTRRHRRISTRINVSSTVAVNSSASHALPHPPRRGRVAQAHPLLETPRIFLLAWIPRLIGSFDTDKPANQRGSELFGLHAVHMPVLPFSSRIVLPSTA